MLEPYVAKEPANCRFFCMLLDAAPYAANYLQHRVRTEEPAARRALLHLKGVDTAAPRGRCGHLAQVAELDGEIEGVPRSIRHGLQAAVGEIVACLWRGSIVAHPAGAVPVDAYVIDPAQDHHALVAGA